MLKLKIGAKVMLKVNLDIYGRLINSQRGNISHTEFGQGSVWKVYAKFSDERTGGKAMRSSYLRRQNSWIPTEAEIPIKKGSISSFIKRS